MKQEPWRFQDEIKNEVVVVFTRQCGLDLQAIGIFKFSLTLECNRFKLNRIFSWTVDDMKQLFRKLIYILLDKTFGNRRGVNIVLLYHSINRDIPQGISKKEFKNQLEFLRDHFDRFSTVNQLKKDNQYQVNEVFVTFDDGYLDNFRHAKPLLDEFNIPATFFISTKYLGGTFPASAEDIPMMNSDQIRKLSHAGHEIASHTVSHPKLPTLSDQEIKKELSKSQERLKKITSDPITSFAYPSGQYDERIIEILKDSHYERAFTTQEKIVDSDDSIWELPRVSINNQITGSAFSVKTSNALFYLNKFKQWQWFKI
jgi:peptidoglycan/xylan/chitin deacetylase (PgdA/CDA1 family)